MPFSQVAEQGLHGPATHLPGERQDGKRTKGLPDRSQHRGPAVGGKKADAALQLGLEIIPDYQSCLSRVVQWSSQDRNLSDPTPHVRLLLSLCLHPAILGHLCSGVMDTKRATSQQKLWVTVWLVSLFLLSAVRTAGPVQELPHRWALPYMMLWYATGILGLFVTAAKGDRHSPRQRTP